VAARATPDGGGSSLAPAGAVDCRAVRARRSSSNPRRRPRGALIKVVNRD
jgi:hypothetical protein